LGGESDGQNIEGLLHGPDNVPGPAYVDPGNPASSPSMAIHSGADLCDKFSWEETYQKNVDEGNGWKNRLPIEDDFTNNSKYIMFYERNFIMVMHGLKLINQDAIQKEYQCLNNHYKELMSQQIENEKLRYQNETFLTHKQYLELIRATI
jgi:hypothetical protein